MDTPPKNSTRHHRRGKPATRPTSRRTTNQTRRPDIKPDRRVTDKTRLSSGGLTHLHPRLAAAQPTSTRQRRDGRPHLTVAAGPEATVARPGPPARDAKPRQRGRGLAWLSAVIAVAGHGCVTGALITGRIDPGLGIAVVLASTACALLLITAEAVQRRSHADQKKGSAR